MLFGLVEGRGFTVTSLQDLDVLLGAVRAAGFGGVTLRPELVCGRPSAAAKLVAAHELVCTDLEALSITRDDEATMAAVERLRPSVEALNPVGVQALVRTRISEESLDRLGRASDRLGVPLLIEFGTAPVPTAAAASEVVAALGTSRARVLADAFHFFRVGSTIDMLETIPLDHLALVQFDDALPVISDDYMAETINRRTWPGEGEFDLHAFAGALRRRGWDGVVTVEVFSEEHRKLPVDAFARRAYATALPYWQ